MQLSIIMPAYRQERTIVEDVRAIDDVLRSLNLDYEIIVVVDGLVDETYTRAKTLDSDRIRVLAYPQNGGKGHAVRIGMRQARGALVAFLDAGMDLDPTRLPRLLELLHNTGADIVVGSKRHPESVVHYPPLRRLYSAVYQAIVWLLFGLNVRDTQVGMKLFKREVIEDIEPLLLVKRFAFDVELLVVARLMGHKRVVEAPITLIHGRFPSTIRLRSIVEMLWDTMAVFYRARILHYYQRLAPVIGRPAGAVNAESRVPGGRG